MKHVGNQINKIIKAKGLKQINVAKELGMSAVNLSKILKKESIDSNLLDKFAKILNISVTYFFQEKESDEVNEQVAHYGKGNELVKSKGGIGGAMDAFSKNIEVFEQWVAEKDKLLAEKDRLIAEKERYIAMLEKRVAELEKRGG